MHPIHLRAEGMSLANGRFLQDKALQPLCQRLAGPGRVEILAVRSACGCEGRMRQFSQLLLQAVTFHL